MLGRAYLLNFLLVSFFSSINGRAQTPVVTVVSNYSTSSTGLTYSLGGSTYYFGNLSGTTNNIQTVVGFNLPDGSYYYNVFVEGQIRIRRVNNPVVTGLRCLVWVEARESPGTYNVLLPYIDSMELFFNGQTLNKGTDNLFGNQGDGSGNNNNIERVDWVVQAGMSAANPNQSGFPIFERGADNAHDPFCIAAITSLDGNGNPLSYGPIVRVATANYGNMMNSDLNWSILRKEEAEPRLYRTTAGVQRRGGVFVSMADLGVSPDIVIYGYSLFAHDLPLSATQANLLDYTNATYFPTNTSSNTTLGGIDLIAIAGLYNITDGVVLPLTCAKWEATIRRDKITLSWMLQNTNDCSFMEIEKSSNGTTWYTLAKRTPYAGNYIDDKIEKENFYRLKLYRTLGGVDYSSIKKLRVEDQLLSLISVHAFPRQFQLLTVSKINATLTVVVYNSSGRALLQKTYMLASITSRLSLPHSLVKGIYVVEVTDGKHRTNKKIAVQ